MASNNPSSVARAFFQSIARAKSPDPIYYVFGEESYLLDRAVENIVKLATPDGPSDFNYDLFHGKDLQGDQLRSTVETLPFMAPRRVVIVRDLQEMDLRQLQSMEDYFTNPAPSTCLIFHAMTLQKGVDGRNSFVKKLKKAATVGEFKQFKVHDAEKFIEKQAHDRNMRLSDAAIAHLIQAIGPNLAEIDLAMTKIDLYLGKPDTMRRVEDTHVKDIIAETRSHTVFELTDALGAKQLEEALHILDSMLTAGEAPIMINQMIARHFRIIAKLQDPSLRNADRNQKAKAAGIPSFFLNDYQRQAAHFSAQNVERILEQLVDVDIALKSSKLKDRVHVEHLIMEIALSTPARRAGARS